MDYYTFMIEFKGKKFTHNGREYSRTEFFFNTSQKEKENPEQYGWQISDKRDWENGKYLRATEDEEAIW